MFQDTIAGIATAMGEGAISIIRVSSKDAISITNKLLNGRDLHKAQSHTINYGFIYNPETGEKVDEVLISVMRAPRTFTAEDVVEINCHGGILVTNKILELLLVAGARVADPGEFTKRAFLNGRIDLAQAESIMDIIHAKSEQSLSLALNGLDGRISRLIKEMREEILNIIANIEVNIDYPEYDDVEEMTSELLLPLSMKIREKMIKLLETAKTGQILRDGIKTAIIGRPNVGKSSLLNQLMREEKAIVTDIAGTTRDTVEGYINVGGLTLNLIDTAGIRETTDIVEAIGVEKSKKILSEAQLILLVLNNNEPLTDQDRQLLKLTDEKKRIIILNKTDLESNIERNEIPNYIETSMVLDEGIELLENSIKEMFELGEIGSTDMTYISNARHIAKLKQALTSLEDAIEAMKIGMLVDMVEIDIKNAWHILGEILGEDIGDALLDELFSKFCLGK